MVSFEVLSSSRHDPTPIFEHFRGSYATELLTAAVVHFGLFELLAEGSCPPQELGQRLGLADRPLTVLVTALRAMGLLNVDAQGSIGLSELAREQLTPGSHDIRGYIGLAGQSPGVLAMVERLRANCPAGTESQEQGAAFIYREGLESAMEKEDSARALTLALAGRARNVAPILAERLDLGEAERLLDVGGGTGLYSIACLQRFPTLHAIVWDRPEVLKVAEELAVRHGVAERLECRAGDMFRDPVPAADVQLLSNVLHDWDVPQCQALVSRCAAALPPGGRLVIHDVFLDDDLGGPLPVALYSAALFCLTEGRAYSGAEYRTWLEQAGLKIGTLVPTLVHCGVLTGLR